MRYLFILFIINALTVNAQENTTIAGKVLDSSGNGIPGAFVGVKNTKIKGSTTAVGAFSLSGNLSFPLTISVSSVGFQTKEITILSGTQSITLILKDASLALQEVEIIGNQGESYKPAYTFSATKTGVAIMDVPQSVSIVTKELIQDQQGFRTGDVVKNVSGVNQFSGYNDFTLRGFRSSTQLINGLRTYATFWSQPNLVNIERVEVIKGPAAALFGNTDPGGTINRVTKKPLDVNKKAISFVTGSFNTYRATADFTGPANESKTLLYRLNIGYENSETFKTLQGFQDVTVAPSISFIPNKKTRVNFDLAYSLSDGKLYRGQPIFGANAGTNLYSTPTSFAIAKPNDYQKEKNFYSTISLNHQFNDKLSFNASYLKYQYKEDLLEHRTSNSYALDGAGIDIPTSMQMQIIKRLGNTYNDNITTYFVNKAKTGALEHQILVGYDYNRISVPKGGSSQTARGYRLKNGGIANNYSAAKKTDYVLDSKGNPIPNVPHFNLETPDYSIADVNNYITSSSSTAEGLSQYSGVYIQDQIKWKKFSLLLGLRKEFVTDYINYNTVTEQKVKQNALIPRVGIVYGILPNLNTYATYVEGFVPQESISLANPNTGGPFDPLTSKMFEGGFKGEFFNRRVLATVGIYQIEQNNVLINANDAQNPELLLQRGQERARGIEFDIAGRVLPNFSISTNYAYNRTIITKDSDPSLIGKLKENAPEHQGGFWGKYNIVGGSFDGLGFGLGSNFVSARRTFSALLTLPSYVTVDAAVYYKIDNFQISGNLFNAFDKTYWVGGYSFTRLFPAAPRNFLIGISYTFN